MSLFDTIKDVGTIGAGFALGGVPGGAAAAAFVGSQNRNQANADIAAANNAWSAEQYATRYQTQVADLKAAGLNPMLAYMQSPGQAPVAQNYQFDAPYSAATEAYNQAKGTSGSYERDISSAGQSRAMTSQIEESTNKVKQEIVNLQSDNERVKQMILNLEEERQNLMKQGFNLTEQGNVMRATISKLRAEVPWLNIKTEREDVLKNLDQLDLSAALKFENFGREFKQYEPIIQLLKSVLRR